MVLLLALFVLLILLVLFLFWGTLSFIIALIISICKTGIEQEIDRPIDFWERWKDIFTFGLMMLP